MKTINNVLKGMRYGIMGLLALTLPIRAFCTGEYTITFGPEGGTKEISTPAAGRTEYNYTYAQTGVYNENWIENVWAWGYAIDTDGVSRTTWHSLIRLNNGLRYAGISRYITGYANAFKVKVQCAKNTTNSRRSFRGRLNERDTLTIVQEAGADALTVSFVANGGSSCNARQYTMGGTYGSLPTTTRNGYTFDGWYSDSSLTTRVYASSTVSAYVTTLYAKWTAIAQKVTVTFVSNGGGDYATKQYTVGDRYGSLPYPGKSGYSFIGWYSDAGLTQRITASSTVSENVTTLYAKYEPLTYPPAPPSISIATYGANANSEYIRIEWEPVAGVASYDIYRSTSETRPDTPLAWSVTSPYLDRKSSGLIPGTRYYYWVASKSAGGTSYSNRDWGNIAEKETAQTYILRLHRNNSKNDGATAGRTYTVGVGRALPKAQADLKWAPRAGYDFLGWATSANATAAKYSDGQILKDLTTTACATVHLYAVWKAHSYLVRLHRNNSMNDGATAGRAFAYDQVRFLPTTSELKWTRTGYMFLGWSQSQGSSTVKYADGLNVFNLSATDGATVHIWGVWKAAPAGAYLLRLHRNNSERDGATAGRQLKLNTNRKLPTVKELGWSRSGYTFAGWATNAKDAAAGRAVYPDGANVRNLATATGATVHLYSVWK